MSKLILLLSFLVAGCAELNNLFPTSFMDGKGNPAEQTAAEDANAIAAQDAQLKTPRERQIASYDRRINTAKQQCVAAENGCNKGCLGVGAVGLISALMGNSNAASTSQAQITQCTNRCDQAKNDCDQKVQSLEQERQQVASGASGAGVGNVGGISNATGGSNVGGAGAGSPAACGSTQQESFRMFNKAFADFTARWPNLAGRGGARDQYQYTYFFSTNGLQILETYRSCLSAADFQANTNALVGARDQGKKGCEQLSSSSGTCTPTYPWK